MIIGTRIHLILENHYECFYGRRDGFLGYHAVKELQKRGHRVTLLALPPLPAQGLFAPETSITLANLNELADVEVLTLLTGQDALVFVAGADDRLTPKATSYPFFYRHNVQASKRLFELARRVGVNRAVVLGSYFDYFHRRWPEMHLIDLNPYIRSRVEQEQVLIETGGSKMAMMILELPYIFGSMPGRIPLWKPLVEYIRSHIPLFYPRGGTNCVAVEHIAEAIAGAVESGKAGERYQIGDENLTWVQLLGKISLALGKEKKVITLPDWTVLAGAWMLKQFHRIKGLESGLDPVELVKSQTAETYFDASIAQNALGFSGGGLDNAIRKTVIASIP